MVVWANHGKSEEKRKGQGPTLSHTAGQEVLDGDTLPSCQRSSHRSVPHQKTRVTRNTFYVLPCASKRPCVAQSCVGVKLLRWLQVCGSTWCQLRVPSPRGTVGFFPIPFCLIPTSSDREEMIVRRVGGISLSILVVFSLVQTLQAAGLGHTHRSSQTLNLSTPVDQQIT